MLAVRKQLLLFLEVEDSRKDEDNLEPEDNEGDLKAAEEEEEGPKEKLSVEEELKKSDKDEDDDDEEDDKVSLMWVEQEFSADKLRPWSPVNPDAEPDPDPHRPGQRGKPVKVCNCVRKNLR